MDELPAPDKAATTRSGRACRRIRRLIDHGAPWQACDAFHNELAKRTADAGLLFWGALAHARAGAAHAAHGFLDDAQAAAQHGGVRLADILSLRGRLWKDAFHRAPDRAGALQNVERARAEYLKAYELTNDSYPGINAATLSKLLGDRASAERLAREVIARLPAASEPRTVWDFATEGEARLLLGDVDAAAQNYAAAYRAAEGNAGIVATMRRQLNLLARVIPDAAHLLPLLPAPNVLAFAGHMLDPPDESVPRFPAGLVPAVREAIRERLAQVRTPIVFTSAACGADLLFIDAAFERGAEVNIVLPFTKRDFVRTSVAVAGDEWVRRFDAALARATRVIMATDEAYLEDDVLFEHAALLIEGFSMLRAEQLQTSPSLLCVIDVEDPGGNVGGTRATLDRWRRNVGAPNVIDLRELRIRNGFGASVAKPLAVASQQAEQGASESNALDLTLAPNAGEHPRRTLKTMLFADFAGYSRLHDTFAPRFQRQFLETGAALIQASDAKPLEAKTWGDALYAVFESPRDGAEFALCFLERMLAVDWTAAGLPSTSQVRIALHAGPVFRDFDPVMGRDSYFGSSVTRTARIEPVTPPGMVYTSESFAATLTATGQREYALEYIGRVTLAKGYGESRMYRLDRR